MNGRAYAEHQAPLHEVGALLEAKAVHNGRSARNHLLVLASTCGISARRVDELLDRVFVGVLLVLPVVASALPQTWGDRINKWLPSNAGHALMPVASDNTTLSPWRGFIVFCGYAIAALVVAGVLLRRRDA